MDVNFCTYCETIYDPEQLLYKVRHGLFVSTCLNCGCRSYFTLDGNGWAPAQPAAGS